MVKTKAIEKSEETIPQKDIEIYDRYIAPDVDIYETENEYVVLADMPGVTKERLTVKLDRQDLKITGDIAKPENSNEHIFLNELCNASYHRHFTLADDVNRDKIEANLESGVLHLILPKKESHKPRDININ